MSREKLSDSPLKKVVWQAVIDGPLMSYTSSQQYHNDRKDPVEINYSFPLPYGKSVISKFRANINGVVREGKAYPKKEAEQKYEDAIESGDTPIMLEITEKDFCTASLGNILPGEDANGLRNGANSDTHRCKQLTEHGEERCIKLREVAGFSAVRTIFQIVGPRKILHCLLGK